MSLESAADELLAAVEASPRAVAAHDKAAWVGLFTADAVVNDPVGSRPHIGTAAIERFYDTFIAPNTIAFHVERDIVGPATVLRDLTIETTMSTGATVAVPMHLRYDLVEQDGVWKIAHLAAHWELGAMIMQLLRTGLPGIGAALKLGPQLIAHQGVGGVAGMMRALLGVGGSGKREAARVFSAAAATDIGRVRALLGGGTVIELPAGTPISVEEFTNRARNMRWHKLIAAGRTVTATVDIDAARGVAVVEFAAGANRVTGISLFLDTGAAHRRMPAHRQHGTAG
ncbi:nuclear transport factor 2 family protein [Nocardia sp. NPDC052566]|uniref:nuclear transport factor 2 family protein n=1 Tax=Nocardia sp. NPDC052566 TaxID=3364330 RepID=UPI0037C9E8AA